MGIFQQAMGALISAIICTTGGMILVHQYERQKTVSMMEAARKDSQTVVEGLQNALAEKQQLLAEMNGQQASLKENLKKLQADREEALREKEKAVQKAEAERSVVAALSQKDSELSDGLAHALDAANEKEEMINKLQEQLRGIQTKLAQNGAQKSVDSTSPKPTVNGFRRYLNELKSQSGRYILNNKGAHYTGGPLAGLSNAQAEIYAEQEWQKLSPGVQMAYERKAELYGSSLSDEQGDPAGKSDPSSYSVIGLGGGNAFVIPH
ncbi:MAG: hypothetical protein PW734_01410 [Verrucomicrobium sp.]|nr:hypothetical protein [Verrucomicrobium sp.]